MSKKIRYFDHDTSVRKQIINTFSTNKGLNAKFDLHPISHDRDDDAINDIIKKRDYDIFFIHFEFLLISIMEQFDIF